MQLPLLIYLSLFKDGQSVTQKRGGEDARKKAVGVCTMQSRASVAKVGRLRWGVSIARVHWCMNAAKSNASLDRQEGVGKVKATCRGRAAVHRRQGATMPPSLSPSLSLFCIFLLCSTYLFIFPCISSSLSLLLLLPVWCHGGGHSPNKEQRSQRRSARNKRETEREHSYSENISISLRNTN